MKDTYTHISMVIDRSGSMYSCWSDVVGGYESIVRENKGIAGECTFTVAAFDTGYELIEDFTDIQQVDEKLKVNPRGGTALLDAIGKTIVSVGEKLAAMKEEDRPHRVMMLVQSDGFENSSRAFNKADIKKMIDEHTNVYKWQFQFIGADLDSLADAVSYGFRPSNVSTVELRENQEAWTILNSKMRSARTEKDDHVYCATMAFSDNDKTILNKWDKVLNKTK